MNKKKFRLSKHGTWLLENDRRLFHWANDDVEIVECLNNLYEENEQLKIRFKEERDTVMRLESECDDLTIKNQKLELEIIRLEMIIKTGKGELND